MPRENSNGRRHYRHSPRRQHNVHKHTTTRHARQRAPFADAPTTRRDEDLITNVTMAVNTSNADTDMFALTSQLVHVYKCPASLRVQVNDQHIPSSIRYVIAPLLDFVGHEIGKYHEGQPSWMGDNDWTEHGSARNGLLKYPERHTMQSADVTLGIIALMRWRRCTGFVALQNSRRGVSAHLYLSDKVMHNAASFGTSCEGAFGSYAAFRTHMMEILDAFLSATEPRSIEVHELVSATRATHPQNVRIGM